MASQVHGLEKIPNYFFRIEQHLFVPPEIFPVPDGPSVVRHWAGNPRVSHHLAHLVTGPNRKSIPGAGPATSLARAVCTFMSGIYWQTGHWRWKYLDWKGTSAQNPCNGYESNAIGLVSISWMFNASKIFHKFAKFRRSVARLCNFYIYFGPVMLFSIILAENVISGRRS